METKKKKFTTIHAGGHFLGFKKKSKTPLENKKRNKSVLISQLHEFIGK